MNSTSSAISKLVVVVPCPFIRFKCFTFATRNPLPPLDHLDVVVVGCREQRVTHLVIFLLVGVSVFMTPMLKLIPMPVLYGIFLYMGLSPLSEMQFFDRMRIFFMPSKYQPDLPYLRQVRLKRIHLFTLIQLVCFAILWFVKMNETISITFPLMVNSLSGLLIQRDQIGPSDLIPFLCCLPTVGDHHLRAQVSRLLLHQGRVAGAGRCPASVPAEGLPAGAQSESENARLKYSIFVNGEPVDPRGGGPLFEFGRYSFVCFFISSFSAFLFFNG